MYEKEDIKERVQETAIIVDRRKGPCQQKMGHDMTIGIVDVRGPPRGELVVGQRRRPSNHGLPKK